MAEVDFFFVVKKGFGPRGSFTTQSMLCLPDYLPVWQHPNGRALLNVLKASPNTWFTTRTLARRLNLPHKTVQALFTDCARFSLGLSPKHDYVYAKPGLREFCYTRTSSSFTAPAVAGGPHISCSADLRALTN